MIIKSLFKRYDKWNPVHPTYGAFWGIGVGIGCGVGWGPGFGPEVIGYVGAGCGAGFNVGITLLGVGIGLPANYHFTIPHSAFVVKRRNAIDVGRAGSLLGNDIAGDGWGDIMPRVSNVQQSLCASLSGFKIDSSLTENIRDFPDMKSMLICHAKHMSGCLQKVSGRFFPWDMGSEELSRGP